MFIVGDADEHEDVYQAMGLPGPSLDFKADRVENRVGLNDRAALCTLTVRVIGSARGGSKRSFAQPSFRIVF